MKTKQLKKETTHQLILDLAMEMIVMRSKPESLQKKVIDIDVKHENIGITWRNKDKSVFIMVIKANPDPETQDLGSVAYQTIKYSEKEYADLML